MSGISVIKYFQACKEAEKHDPEWGKKNQRTETDPEQIQILESADKDTNIVI